MLAGYLVLAAFLLSLWVLADPLVRTAALAAVAGLVVGARRAARLAWCVHVCRELTFDLAGAVRITITRTDGPS